MDLFSCRNCIYNPSQGLTLGVGSGYCMKWRSLIERPERTTCKYLHRKDLPRFLTEASLLEHAEEFASCPSMVDLTTHEARAQRAPGEKREASVSPLTWAVLTCHAIEDRRLAAKLPLLFAGSIDGGRALVHASLDALKFPMEELGTSVSEQSWPVLRRALAPLKLRWRTLLDTHSAMAVPVLKDKAVSKGQSSPLRELH